MHSARGKNSVQVLSKLKLRMRVKQSFPDKLTGAPLSTRVRQSSFHHVDGEEGWHSVHEEMG
jgi:hypothetical protein